MLSANCCDVKKQYICILISYISMKLFLTLVLLFFANCDTTKKEDSLDQDKTTANSLQLSKNDVESIDYIDYGLSSASKKATIDWKNYSELETIISSIKTGDLSYFESDKEILKSFNLDLQASLPANINSQPIIVRLRSLETKLLKLRSAVSLSTTPKTELIITIKELLVAVSNLNLQINKKLEKEAQDISKTSL